MLVKLFGGLLVYNADEYTAHNLTGTLTAKFRNKTKRKKNNNRNDAYEMRPILRHAISVLYSKTRKVKDV